MTSDSTLLHHPTESLILSAKRRFFPFRIPNFHTQLRHYISTADPDRIYVIVERIIYAIHISAQKRESIAAIPFEPRGLAAAYGWIGVGGPENGECAFIKIGDQGMQVHGSLLQNSDVDSALPLDLNRSTRSVSPDTAHGNSARARRLSQDRFPEVELHKFGGSIVNSVTIHRFLGDKDGVADEDVMVLSNNDCTVTVYSLTRATVLKILDHPKYMNYATISPDSRLLTAVGDEDRAYFYKISRDWESTFITGSGKRLTGWDFDLTWCVEMDIGPRPDDATCFTVAFSPSSHLCAVGSQSGIITVLDTETIHKKIGDADNSNPIVCQFPASRSCAEGGAVRCMTFSPEPWDLLVWLEGHGRAGVADVRQAFLRRQILQLDADAPDLQEVHMEPFSDVSEGQRMEDESMRATPRTGLDEELNESGEGVDRASLRDTLIQDLTERERLIMDFLNNARFTSRLEEGLTERPERPARVALQPHPTVRTRVYGSTDGTIRASRPASPPNLYDFPRNISHDSELGPSPRRQSSVVLSQGNRSSETGTSSHDRQPSITLNWTTPPSELQSTESDSTSRNVDPDIDVGHESNRPMRPPEVTGPTPATLDFGLSSEGMTRLRSQRSSSTLRRTERAPSGPERRYDPSRLSNYEIRANVAAERLRRQRQIANEVHNRSFEREHRHRQQFLGFEQAHSPRWIRNIINDLPDRSLIHGPGAEEPDSTAGVGWGADGRTLYIATLEGIFEFQINVQDRKTFPVFSCR